MNRKTCDCDVNGCPESKRCLDKEGYASRCAMYRMMHREDLWVYNYNNEKFDKDRKM